MTSIEIARAFYIAVATDDIAAVLASLHPQLRWTEAQGFPYFSGTWHTPREVVEKLLVPISQDWDRFTVTPHEFLVDGDRVVTFGTYAGTHKLTGNTNPPRD